MIEHELHKYKVPNCRSDGSFYIKRESNLTPSLSVKPFFDRVNELTLSKTDFDFLAVIGRGAFGEVGNSTFQ